MTKLINNRMKKLAIALILSLSLAATPVFAAAGGAEAVQDPELAAQLAAAEGELEASAAVFEEADAAESAAAAVVESAMEKAEAAETALEDAKKQDALISAESAEKYEALEKALKTAKADVENAGEAFVDAEAAVEAAETNVLEREATEAQALLDMNEAAGIRAAAENKEAEAAAELDAANKALAEAEEDHEKELATLQKAVDEAQEVYDGAGLSYVLKNCIEYTDSDGNPVDSLTMWIDTMSKNSTVEPYLGDEFNSIMEYQFMPDSLEKAMGFIDECNELREIEGVDPVYVNYDLMLFSAISNAISAQAGYMGGHLLFNEAIENDDLLDLLFDASGNRASENLAWGYVDPFDGWYYKEKALYDNGIRDSRVGHYENIRDSKVNCTGFAMSAGRASEQCFGYHADASLTTAQFLSGLETYSKTAKDALDKAKANLAAADDSAVKNAEAAVSSATAALNEAKAEKTSAADAYEAKTEAYEDAKAATEAAKKSLQDAKDALETAAADKDSAGKAYNDAKNAVDTFVFKDGKELVNKAEAALAAAQKELEKAENAYDAAKAELTEAEKTYNEKAEAVELLNVKIAAVEDIIGYKDLNDYREEQKAELSELIEKAKADIKAAETTDDVEQILAEAKAEADRIKTDEELTELEKRILGDADSNGKVLANDAMLVLQYSTKANDGSNIDLTVCDVDGNGRILANDAMLILQYSTKVIDKFPVEK